jgi:hypothetical protein
VSVVKTPSYKDDLSNVEGLTLVKDEAGETAAAGANLPTGQRVSIVMTQGDSQYEVDTAQSNPLAAHIRSVGVKRGKRGRKAS